MGAEVVNFRRAVVWEEVENGYCRRRTAILIKDGRVECHLREHTLTDEQRKLIATELTAANFPKSINASRRRLPPQLCGVDPEEFFVFYDRNGQEIQFIQWRKGGEKPDLPLTFWSDGEWRFMEPDGLLPLYGLDRLKDSQTVFLHEGAKAARDVQTMVDDAGDALAKHPWGEALKRAVHIGWPGGAPNPDRVDWGPIRALAPQRRVVVISDHDPVGEEAVTKISSILRRAMLAVVFDSRFPLGFDLADPWPSNKDWSRGQRYAGPTFDDCVVPATWATDIVHAGNKGRPAISIRNLFAEEWYWADDPPVFAHRNQANRLLNTVTFNRSVRPFSDADDTARLLLHRVSSQCDGVAYLPGQKGGIINVDGRRVINSYRPSTIESMKGRPRPFLDFMEHLIPDESDRELLLRWCATLIARPDIRMSYGVLMISQVQGVGKGTLGEAILAPILGDWNVSYPDEQQVTESAFNAWLAHKRLAVVHEIYSGHSVKAYNRLKSVITDKNVTVNEKYTPAYTLENYIHVFACSNSERALRLDDNDRRWLVPKVTEEIKSVDYWRALRRWLNEDGLAIIKYWAENFLRKNGPVYSGEHAPPTSAKNEIIVEGRSEGVRLAFDLGERVHKMAEVTKVVLAVEDVRDWVADQRKLDRNDSRLERSLTLRNALKAAGLKEPTRKANTEQRRFQINAARKSHIMANFDIGVEEEWPAIKRFHKMPNDLWPI